MNFLYADFYRPYQKNELKPFRKFIQAKLTDNPFRPKNYERSLDLILDAQNKARLLKGEWDFDGDKTRLIKYDTILDMYSIPKNHNTEGKYFISADIAFSGDKCIILLWKGLTIVEVIHYKGDEPEKEIIKIRDKHNVSPRNIVYDADGVGKYLKAKLRGAYDFINNSVPINKENYDNIKSQVYFKLAEQINEGNVKILDPTLKDDLIQEAYEIRSQPLDTIDGKLKLVKKKEVSAIIGRSPDVSDAMAFRMVFEVKGNYRVPF
jgi:hypothetical protein